MVLCDKEEYKDACIAILLATYNGQEYIYDQLNSIESQTNQNFICFIHDDASTDSTVEIIKNYCASRDKFVFLGSHKCGGATQNFMYLMNHVDADYVMFSDQDDVWLPEKIEISFSTLKKIENEHNQNIPLCIYSDVKVVDSNLCVIQNKYRGINGKKNSTKDLLKHNVVMGCSMMFNRSLLKEMVKVEDIKNIYMYDWWGSLICSIVGVLFYIQEPLMLYRQHNNNTVGAKKEKKYSQKIKSLFSFKDFYKEKKEWLTRPRKLAREIIKVIPVNNSQYNFLRELAFIQNKSKIKRIVFYRKNNLIISTSNTLVQLLFI